MTSRKRPAARACTPHPAPRSTSHSRKEILAARSSIVQGSVPRLCHIVLPIITYESYFGAAGAKVHGAASMACCTPSRGHALMRRDAGTMADSTKEATDEGAKVTTVAEGQENDAPAAAPLARSEDAPPTSSNPFAALKKGFESAVQSATGNAEYQFGDATKWVGGKAAGAINEVTGKDTSAPASFELHDMEQTSPRWRTQVRVRRPEPLARPLGQS